MLVYLIWLGIAGPLRRIHIITNEVNEFSSCSNAKNKTKTKILNAYMKLGYQSK